MGWNLTGSLTGAIGGAAAGSSLGPWGAVGGAVVGGVAGGLSEDPNEVAREEAQKNRDFQAEMSNTAHQREVKDLQAAGLNPLMSANSGASTPSGSMAQTFDKSTAEMQRAQMMANIAQISASSARTIAETKNVEANTRIAEANAQVAPEKAQADLNTAKANSAIAASEARQFAVRADYLDSPGGRTAYAVKQYGDAVGSWVNPISGAYRNFKGYSASGIAADSQSNYVNSRSDAKPSSEYVQIKERLARERRSRSGGGDE